MHSKTVSEGLNGAQRPSSKTPFIITGYPSVLVKSVNKAIFFISELILTNSAEKNEPK